MTESLFPKGPDQVSLKRQIECVDREVTMRERVFERRVAKGFMTQAKASNEIAAMRAVAATLRQVRDATLSQPETRHDT